jgi:hypothetical protein
MTHYMERVSSALSERVRFKSHTKKYSLSESASFDLAPPNVDTALETVAEGTCCRRMLLKECRITPDDSAHFLGHLAQHIKKICGYDPSFGENNVATGLILKSVSINYVVYLFDREWDWMVDLALTTGSI